MGLFNKLWYNTTMRVIKKITKLKKLAKTEDSFVKAPPKELVSFMWELTREIWSLRGTNHAERRLQRNITNLIKQ